MRMSQFLLVLAWICGVQVWPRDLLVVAAITLSLSSICVAWLERNDE